MADAPVICEDCEKVFRGGPNAHFCPECRRERLRMAARNRNLNKLGNAAYTKKKAARKEHDHG